MLTRRHIKLHVWFIHSIRVVWHVNRWIALVSQHLCLMFDGTDGNLSSTLPCTLSALSTCSICGTQTHCSHCLMYHSASCCSLLDLRICELPFTAWSITLRATLHCLIYHSVHWCSLLDLRICELPFTAWSITLRVFIHQKMSTIWLNQMSKNHMFS